MVLLLSISVIINLASICILVWLFFGPMAKTERRGREMIDQLQQLREYVRRSEQRMENFEYSLSRLAELRRPPNSAGSLTPSFEPLSKSYAVSDPKEGTAKPEPPPLADLSTVQPLLDYNKARSMELEDGEQWFSERYPELKRLSCTNRTALASRQVDLRFEFSARGAFLALAYGRQFLLFPVLTDKFSVARGLLEGVFLYPPESPGKLILTRPALVERSPEGVLLLARDGHGEFVSRPVRRSSASQSGDSAPNVTANSLPDSGPKPSYKE